MMLPKPNDGFAWVQAAAGPALVCAALEPYALHLFTTRAWALGDPDADRDLGWADVARALQVAPGQLVRAHQVHGRSVIVRKRGAPAVSPEPPPAADIIVTDDPGIAIAIQAADCVPMLLADPRTGAVAAAHAGWRGLAARVPQAAIDALAHHFGSRPADLIAAVGPSISAARYEVDAPVRGAFERGGFDDAHVGAWFPHATRTDHWQFDGLASARDQLIAAVMVEERVHAAGLCTGSNDVLCSYRRDARRSGRSAAAIRRRA
jgi:purine-nucleoside/S-methyl-5'-thioadenosine phosphorylase / adenosine deaminase